VTAALEERGGLQHFSWEVACELSSTARKSLTPRVEGAMDNLRVRAARARRYVNEAHIARRAFEAKSFIDTTTPQASRPALFREIGQIWYKYCQFIVHRAVLPVAKQYIQVLEHTFDSPAPSPHRHSNLGLPAQEDEMHHVFRVASRPARLGITYLPDTGRVAEVEPGGWAIKNGIRVGWKIHEIEGQRYSDQRYEAFRNGGQDFTLVFMQEIVDESA
jgi:hypothetical protein